MKEENVARNSLTATAAKQKPVATTANQLGEAVDELAASVNYLESEAQAILRNVGQDGDGKAVADGGSYPGMSAHHSQLDSILSSVRRISLQVKDITDRLEV